MDELVANLSRPTGELDPRSRLDGRGDQAAAPTRSSTTFRPKIGYPDKWRDYSALGIDAGDLLGNVKRATAFEIDRELAQDRRPGRPRRVVHDAADGQRLLQPRHQRDRLPGRHPAAAVLRRRRRRRRELRRHRRRHRPRDRPRLRRPGRRSTTASATCTTGGPTDDRAAFEERADGARSRSTTCSSRATCPASKVNGALTVGENIGDLGGLTIGYSGLPHLARRAPGARARRLHRPAAVLPRLGPGVARQVPARGGRAAARRSTRTARWSCGPTSCATSTEFHEAFGVQAGDGMWLPPTERVRIF